MELKKSKEADLENKVWVFRFLGLIMIASVVLMAFTFVVADADEFVDETQDDGMQDELVFDIEIPEEEPPEVEEEAPPPPIIEDVVEVEDDEEIEEIDLGLDLEMEEPPPIDDGEDEIVAEPIVDFAEVEPSFPGGESAMMTWIQENIKYPQISIEMGEQGIVYVQFVVNKDGSIEQVKIMRGVSDALDDEAKRVVRNMPKWTPGEQAGKKVRVRYTLPIHFRLG
ncbi:MAG: energy transducer TonB [Crocinitomicaceae bacterium]|nr:energy transducer TonB [Crocinitomicaceae bacterium]